MFTSRRHSNRTRMSPLGAASGISASALGTVAIGGGRIFAERSALPLMTADVESASVSAMEPNWPRVAADIGRGFGYLSIALGVAMFIVEGSFSGAWLAFTRWFLLQAATAEARYVATDQALAGLKVGKLMARDPVTVDPDLTVGRFMDEIAWSRRSSPRANPGRTR